MELRRRRRLIVVVSNPCVDGTARSSGGLVGLVGLGGEGGDMD